jgi:hypothetical protein
VAYAKSNVGFDGRVFLTEAEWRTYLRRKPVRYIHKTKAPACQVCGQGPEDDNPFQNAHKIGFDMGIVQLALTPDFWTAKRTSQPRIGLTATSMRNSILKVR